MATLLIAGPSRLEDHGGRQGLLGGAGIYAALAAAPLLLTQLWSQGGPEFNERLLGYLHARRVDLAGFVTEPGTSLLPAAEPVSAEGLGAVLAACLPIAELERCHRVTQGLGGPLLLVLAPSEAGRSELLAAAAHADLLIAGCAQATTALGGDPMRSAQTLQEAGARTVALCAGPLGGLLAYKQKACTWPSMPVPDEPHPGRRAIFAGVLAGQLARHGHLDFRHLKRFAATAGAVAAAYARGPGPLKLMDAGAEDYHGAWLRLRRTAKA